MTGPPFLTPEKIQPNCTIYMKIQKKYIYIDYDEYCQNEFHVSNCPECASVEKSPSKGPIRRQFSYVLKNKIEILNNGICKLQISPYLYRNLEQPTDITSLGVDVHIEVAGGSGQSGNGLNVGSQSVAIVILLAC